MLTSEDIYSSSVNTYSAFPVWGCRTSGEIVRGTFRGLPPPSPVVTAMYCLPPTVNETGKPCTDVPRRDLPQLLASPNVVCVEIPIEITRKHHAPTCRERCRKERRALLDAPHFAHGVHVERSKLADVAVRARHLIEAAVAGRAAGTFLEFHLGGPKAPCTTGPAE